jgi:hypothetical protein
LEEIMRASAGIALCVLPAVLQSQPVTRIPLKPANATLAAEFVGITSIREVADGRVIVTDGRDQQLYVADFKANNASLLGRKGKGPGEWLNIGLVQALSGDSSIIGDFGNLRWMLLDGAKIVGTVPSDHPAVRASSAFVIDIDRLGHILATRNPPARAGTTVFTRADSNALVFIDRNSGRVDTIASLRVRPHRREVQMDSAGRVRSTMPFSTEPNAQAELAKLFNDGWLAVVRLEPLRVDWRSPAGQWTLGKPFPLRPAPVDARERKAIEARRAEARADAKKYGLPAPAAVAYPTTLPVMANAASPRATTEGRLLLRRSSSASNPAIRYLVINRQGNIDGEITLAANEDIIGFGLRSIYIAFKDDDDIQRLRRHPWP